MRDLLYLIGRQELYLLPHPARDGRARPLVFVFLRAIDVSRRIAIENLTCVLRRFAEKVDVLRVRDRGIPEVVVAAGEDDGVDGGKAEGFVFFCVRVDDVFSFVSVVNWERQACRNA